MTFYIRLAFTSGLALRIKGAAYFTFFFKIQTVGNTQHHALANAVKDARKQKHLQDTFEVTTLSPFFCRNHKAIELFNKERLKQAPVPQTMTSFSPTRWNVVSAMFTSLRDNKQTAISFIISQQLAVDEARRLPVHVPKSQAGEATKINMDGEFWRAEEQDESFSD
jgi:hypothetical protein